MPDGSEGKARKAVHEGREAHKALRLIRSALARIITLAVIGRLDELPWIKELTDDVQPSLHRRQELAQEGAAGAGVHTLPGLACFCWPRFDGRPPTSTSALRHLK